MKKVAVILSGAGRFDGSEIHESVAALLAIDRAGATYHCFALDAAQAQVVDHFTQKPITDARNMLAESARIARDAISPFNDIDANAFDAAFYPGGFGAATSLCDFATEGAHCNVQADVLAFSQAMITAGKPQGFACIAPVMIPKMYPAGVKLTIGNDAKTAAAITAMGGQHIDCAVTDVITDKQYKVSSTPAYMLAQHISEVFDGVSKCVHAILA